MTRNACALHEGDRIHITPHDVFRDSDTPVPTEHCPDADITIDAIIREQGWAVVLICWHDGGAHYATVYDADHPIEVAA